jgi:hypothetical protein
VEGQETTPETERSHPLLWAIVEFREALDRLVEEQRALVLNRGVDTAAPDAPPPGIAVGVATLPPQPAPVAVPPVPVPASATVASTPEAEPSARKFNPPGPRPRPTESPTPQPALVPAAEPAAPLALAAAASRPEDPRQRLDALAKLLDRRAKNTTHELAPRPGEG